MLTLNISPRTAREKPEALRKKGIIPAVYYGKKQKSTSISVTQKDFLKVWKQAGESSVVTLKGKDGDVEALIQDVDRDPVTSVFRHADFYVFEKGQKMQISIPIEFEGTSAAVKDLGAILVKALHELKVEAEPKHLPHKIIVDIAPLITMESQILASDIKLPTGVTLVEKPTEVVASVKQFVEEKEEVPVDLTAIEVEKKGKVEEEGVEGATPEAAGTPAKDEKKETKKEDSKGKK